MHALLKDNPKVMLAALPGSPNRNVLLGERGCKQIGPDALPSLLMSFYYLPDFQRERDRYAMRDWSMDSGAFSAHNSGAEIDLEEYIDASHELMANDPQLAEIFALDVIGSWKESRRNTEIMWERGVPAIPCFHHGEPWEVLTELANEYPKIALGGAVGLRGDYKKQWAAQCFARVWPKRIHGFGFGGESQLLSLPWHSVDSTNWQKRPCKFGLWNSFGGQPMHIRGSRQNLEQEILWYLDLEARARVKWRKQMEQLEALPW